jgi:phosphoadenosine phosphosulfate reductase
MTAALHGLDGEALLRAAYSQFGEALALVSSFGAESNVLLHMMSRVAPALPVLFLDTGKLFAATTAYQRELAHTLGLTNIIRVTPKLADEDPDGTLHQRDTNACCAVRKVEPLARALQPYAAWVSGQKRFQSAERARVEAVEFVDGRTKLNPLANWSADDMRIYQLVNELPPHPLVALGYPSIGCEPCTSRVAAGEDARAGRWRGSVKTECGIHQHA